MSRIRSLTSGGEENDFVPTAAVGSLFLSAGFGSVWEAFCGLSGWPECNLLCQSIIVPYGSRFSLCCMDKRKA